MSDVDLEKMCRLCLTPCEPDQLINIFEDSSNLPVRIMACCSIEVQANDSLPKGVCTDCRYQLDKTYIFRIKSKNAESKLKRHIRLINAGKQSHVFEEEEEVDEYEDALKYVQQHEEKQKEFELRLLKSESDSLVQKANNAQETLRSELAKVKQLLQIKTKEVTELKQNVVELQSVQEVVDQGAGQEDEYYVEMLEDETIDLKQNYDIEPMQTDDAASQVLTKDDGEVELETRYECAPEEYAAIEKAVRATLVNQNEPSLTSNFQLRLEKISENMTKAEVVTDDGNILFMEFNTATATTGKTPNRYACSECKVEFSKLKQFKRHLNTHPKDPHQKGIQCQYCNKWCPTSSSLQRHERVHTGEKPFKCGECGKSFIQKEVLKRHQLIHTGERPFSCSVCDERFKSRERLKLHFNRAHLENPVIEVHKCPLCPKTFCHASGLSRHLLYHSGKTFDCEVCLKSYTDRSTLRRHMTSVHGDSTKLDTLAVTESDEY